MRFWSLLIVGFDSCLIVLLYSDSCGFEGWKCCFDVVFGLLGFLSWLIAVMLLLW